MFYNNTVSAPIHSIAGSAIDLDTTFLNATYIPSMLELQGIVYDHLQTAEKKNIVPKDGKKLAQLFNAGSTAMGIFDKGVLIAQSIMHAPQTETDKAGVMAPIHGLPLVQTNVLQGVIVHPQYRGKKIAHHMVEFCKHAMRDQYRPHTLAEVVASNVQSWAVFLDQGFHIHSHVYDPDDEVDLYIMHCNMNTPSTLHAVEYSLPMNDIEGIKSLLGKGYKGHCWQNGPVPSIGFSK
jgi:GNAT superfamily N-acetyltransferase